MLRFADSYKPTQGFPGELAKYIPSDPTSAHWYDAAVLRTLVFNHIVLADNGGRDMPLGEFVRQFRGLASTAKAKAITATFPRVTHLTHFRDTPEYVDQLLKLMKDNSKPPSHSVLGYVGEDHFRQKFENFYGDLLRFSYKKIKGYLPSGLPYTFELALAELLEKKGALFTGVNFSPTFGDPLEALRFKGPEYEATGIGEFLEKGFAHPDWITAEDPDSPLTAVAVHIITPAPLFLDMGKTRLQIEEVG